MTNWVYWAPLVAASLHIVEEFVYPGGFPEWDRCYRPGFRRSISPRFHIIINALLLVVCYDAWALRASPKGIALWLTVAALLFANAVWHVVGSVRTRSYSPGVVTGVAFYVPMTLYGFAHFLRSRQASIATALAACAIGASYQLFVSGALHRWRMRRAKA